MPDFAVFLPPLHVGTMQLAPVHRLWRWCGRGWLRRHRAAGNARWIQPHEYTPNAKTQALVHELLAAEAAAWQ